MAKVGLLLPYADMLQMTEELVGDYKLDIVYKKLISSASAVKEARLAVDAGAEIIVARGYQAMQIKRFTNIPVVEMRLHSQEIGLLLKKAKSIIDKETVSVGLVVFKNMLGDTSNMEEIFDVKLEVTYLDRVEDIPARLAELVQHGVDLIVGGEAVCGEAENMGLLALRYGFSKSAIYAALSETERMSYAIDIEKQNSAQFETVLDASFNGIIKINHAGTILVINKLVENLLGKNLEDVVGQPIAEIFPDFDRKGIQDILDGKMENYTTSVNLRNQSWILLIAPIQYDDQVTGAILSLQKLSGNLKRNSGLQKDMYLNGYVAEWTFEDLHFSDKKMKEQIELAKRYALSESPVLIYSESGTEYLGIGEAIHNNSIRRSGPFVCVNIPALKPEMQERIIFGEDWGGADASSNKAAMSMANHGTVFLKGIEFLTLQAQYQLVKHLIPGRLSRADVQPMDYTDVRIIAQASGNLPERVEAGNFSEELFYLLQGLTLTIPPMKHRPEDLQLIFESCFREYTKKYNKHLKLTQGAVGRLKELSWRGNKFQIGAFCERLVLAADKRSVDEVLVQRIYDELYPKIRELEGSQRRIVYSHPEADELSELLRKYQGNRRRVAEALGISTTTLWRRMKKYGIEAIYDV